MSFKVLDDFIEKKHDSTLYKKGETYPKKGYKADPERVSFLQKVHPKYGVAFLETPAEPPEKEVEEKPKAKSKAKSGDK